MTQKNLIDIDLTIKGEVQTFTYEEAKTLLLSLEKAVKIRGGMMESDTGKIGTLKLIGDRPYIATQNDKETLKITKWMDLYQWWAKTHFYQCKVCNHQKSVFETDNRYSTYLEHKLGGYSL